MLQKLHYLYASCTLSFFYILTSQLSHTVSIAIGVWWKCLCVEALCFRLPVCPPAFSTASECKAVCESSCPGECRLHLNEWPIESPFCALESFVQTLEALRRSPSVCLRVFFFFSCLSHTSPLQFFIFLGQFHLGSKIVLCSCGRALTA